MYSIFSECVGRVAAMAECKNSENSGKLLKSRCDVRNLDLVHRRYSDSLLIGGYKLQK